MELSLLHKTVMLIGTVLFHALDLAVKAHGEIKEQRSILNKSRSSYHNGVIGALQGIYIADVDFEFNEGISEYTLKTDECIRHLEIFFQVPMWMKPETMDYNGVVKEPEDCFVDRRIKPIVGELHTTGPMPQLGNVTEHYDYNDVHKADVTNHGAIGCIGKTPTSDDKIQGDLKRAKVGISVNGQTVDDRDAGYVKLPVHCGMKNTVNIDVRVSDTNNDKLIQYKLDIQVPPKGAKNFLATLEVLGRDGTLEKLEPTLSLAFRTHIVVIKHKEDVTFGVYAECQHGMPTIDDVPGCEANVTLKHNTRKIELVVKCEAFTPTNGKYVVEATIYTLRLERLTADGVPPPRKVISIMETNQCDITLNGENNATNITCIKRSRNFSPLIIETDSDYLYVMQAKHAVDGQVEEIHPLKEDYIQIRNETITPVLDLNSDILIHGFGRNKVETFVISNKSEETSGALYHSILAALIIDAYLCALVTHLLPGIIRGHMGVMFDHVPKIGEPMMYLVQIICAYADERISKVCEHFTMLPNVSNSETDYIQLLGKFYVSLRNASSK
ncbi:hypothetical protein X943_001447 [Babesia divergens]|uniref:Uncharacterized protein n=1 Tax=Babesia divergens TaxID=32595 RepID=A0AAD9GD26_BABDI|nr:hypothetical protein X943_001447 [Babesia divergens]